MKRCRSSRSKGFACRPKVCNTIILSSPIPRSGTWSVAAVSVKPRQVVGKGLHLQIAKRVNDLRHPGGARRDAGAGLEVAQRLVEVILALACEAADVVHALVVVAMAIGAM